MNKIKLEGYDAYDAKIKDKKVLVYYKNKIIISIDKKEFEDENNKIDVEIIKEKIEKFKYIKWELENNEVWKKDLLERKSEKIKLDYIETENLIKKYKKELELLKNG